MMGLQSFVMVKYDKNKKVSKYKRLIQVFKERETMR